MDWPWFELCSAAVRMGIPLLLLALAALLSEKSGIINIGLEGMLLFSCLGAVVGAIFTGSAMLGLVFAVLCALVLMGLFGLFVVQGQQDPILVGTGINLIALGFSGMIFRSTLGSSGDVLSPPVLNPVIFIEILAFLAVPVSWVLLYQTRTGLALRATGEAPHAVAASDFNLAHLRWLALLSGAVLVGLAGAELALVHARTFVEGMSSGRGFIALAIVLFGRHHPFGVLLGSLVFGMAFAVQFFLQAQAIEAVPYQLLRSIPYIVTIVILALSSGIRVQDARA